jgi:hypothetical protein
MDMTAATCAATHWPACHRTHCSSGLYKSGCCPHLLCKEAQAIASSQNLVSVWTGSAAAVAAVAAAAAVVGLHQAA